MRPVISLMLLGIVSASAIASDADGMAYSDSIVALGEVSVTAVKSGAGLRRNPVASTSIGASDIERFNIVNMKQVSEIAPNFYIPEYGSRMTSSIYVRGIGARIDQPVVGLNIDNLPVLNKDNYDFDLPDISRIEILRGPQSVLYGRNTMGGLINIYTYSPLNYQGIRLTGEYGTRNSYRLSLGWYGMFNDRWGMSVTAAASGSDGFFRNEYNGSRVGRERQLSFRHKLSGRLSASLTLDNVLSVTASEQSGYPYESLSTGMIAYNDTCFYHRTAIAEGLTLNWKTSKFTLTSITGGQYMDDNMTLDQDFLPVDYFTLTQKRREWTFTEDVVVKGDAGHYEWLAGLFGFYKYGDMSAPVTFKEYGIEKLIIANRNSMNPMYPIKWNDTSFCLNSDFKLPTSGIALYHNSSYSLGDWNFSAGVRLDVEHVAIKYHNYTHTGYTIYNASVTPPVIYKEEPVDIDESSRLSKTYVQLLPRVSALYRLPDGAGNVYATVAKGYKSGGYNTQMFSDFLQQKLMGQMGMSQKYDVDEIIGYKPERSWNYELGTHLNLLDNRLHVDATVFYIDCRDQQLTMFPDGSTTGRVMANAGKTRSLGAEMSVVYRPDDHWNIRTSYGHSDARFVDFFDGKVNYKGNFVPFAPLNTMFVGGGYAVEFRNGFIDRLSAEVACRGVGRIYWNEDNDVTQPFYTLLSASVTASHGDADIELWGTNLLSASYDTFYFVSIGNAFVQRGNPAKLGVTFRFNFNMQ